MDAEYRKDNLILRVLNGHHAPQVLDFYYRNQHIFNLYETKKPENFYTESYISNLLDAEFNAFVHGKYVRFFLYDTTISDTIIGSVSFSDIKNGAMKSCILGYKIDEQFQRQGYGRRMLTMALKIMVTNCEMHRIEAYISPDNTASIELAKKLGFISEGTAFAYAQLNGIWQDHLRFVYIS